MGHGVSPGHGAVSTALDTPRNKEDRARTVANLPGAAHPTLPCVARCEPRGKPAAEGHPHRGLDTGACTLPVTEEALGRRLTCGRLHDKTKRLELQQSCTQWPQTSPFGDHCVSAQDTGNPFLPVLGRQLREPTKNSRMRSTGLNQGNNQSGTVVGHCQRLDTRTPATEQNWLQCCNNLLLPLWSRPQYGGAHAGDVGSAAVHTEVASHGHRGAANCVAKLGVMGQNVLHDKMPVPIDNQLVRASNQHSY
mmetsp:Transcript_20478/g.44077  ORF Transcript_20478/g.44077 Transcript_20478/m.44077 type:complete len:250 (-) Transcript_20478:622-1371(-)